MSSKTISSYGSWKSPITAELIVAGTVGLSSVMVEGETTFWIEGRPSEGGRYVIVRREADGQIEDVLPQPYNARTLVHEYGGGACTLDSGTLYFSNFADQRIWKLTPGEDPEPITAETKMRYADYVVDRQRNQLLAVREDHSESGTEPTNTIVSISLNDGTERVLASGNDFYSNPRLSPDGNRLAWLAWNHPNMPWDGTELWSADLDAEGNVSSSQCIAGGAEESIFQPAWSPDGTLCFVSDRSGWWNLYRWRDGQIETVTTLEAELGRPSWALGMRTYVFASANEIICIFNEKGSWNLGRLDTASGKMNRIDVPFTSFDSLCASGNRVTCVAGSPTQPNAIVNINVETGKVETLRRSSTVNVETGYLSVPQSIEFPTDDDKTAHAFYYPPTNLDHEGPSEEKPPLLVCSHGGPTSAASATFSLGLQFWTSRGIAVVDVNYGGSTGYGREYRERLKGTWGIVDVNDCANAAKYLVERGEVDGNRLAIRGGSAGGYTTLAVLTFRDDFHAGASHYGVSDLEALAKETHKFESRYLDQLIGPYPEKADLYKERSPIHATDQLSCPVILFQGLEDKIVLPNQAEMMADALRKKGVPVAYVPFEGEQHGFRKAENIKRALEGELYFYSRIFEFELADKVEPVEIENLSV